MTETTAAVWDAVDLEINDWLGDGKDMYCLTDRVMDEMQQNGCASRLVNMIGLKRRIGKVLGARGYDKTSSSPPTWVYRLVCLQTVTVRKTPEIPQAILDAYLSLLQTQAILEKEYPGIEAAVAE